MLLSHPLSSAHTGELFKHRGHLSQSNTQHLRAFFYITPEYITEIMSSFFVCYASSTFRRALTRMSQLCLFRGGNRWEVLSPKMYPQSNAILSSQNFLDSHVLWYLLPFSLRFWGWNAGNVSGACCLWQGLSVVHMTTTTAIQKKTPWPHRCVFTGSPFNLSTTQMNPIHYTYDQGRP